jgi:hypothetical protein
MRLRMHLVLIAAGLVFAGAAQPGSAQKTITCSSDDGGHHTCPVDARAG